MALAEDIKYYSERDNQETVTARVKVVFYIDVKIPDFDQDKVDPMPMIEEAVKDHEFKSEDITDWEFEEWT